MSLPLWLTYRLYVLLFFKDVFTPVPRYDGESLREANELRWEMLLDKGLLALLLRRGMLTLVLKNAISVEIYSCPPKKQGIL